MPHLVILYTANLESEIDMTDMCQEMCKTLLAQHDDNGEQIFPTAGTRVLAYPAPHFAVADSQHNYGFIYLNLRMATGRSSELHEQVGQALLNRVKTLFDPLLQKQHVGITLQIDEGVEVFNARHSSIYPLFSPAA